MATTYIRVQLSLGTCQRLSTLCLTSRYRVPTFILTTIA